MLEILKAVAEALRRFFGFRDRRKREDAERAIVEGDRESVNRDFDNLLRVLLAGALFLLLGGCASYTVIDGAREMKPIVHEGQRGWFVPNARMLEIRRALERAQK